MRALPLSNKPTLLNNAFLLADLAVNGKKPHDRAQALRALCDTGKTLANLAPAWPLCAAPAITISHFCSSLDEIYLTEAAQIVFDTIPYTKRGAPVRGEALFVLKALIDPENEHNLTGEIRQYAEVLTRPGALDSIHYSGSVSPEAVEARKTCLAALAEQGFTEVSLPQEKKAKSFTEMCGRLLGQISIRRQHAATRFPRP